MAWMLPGSAHIGAPVPANLGLVMHAAQANELAKERPGDALPERSLAHAGRAEEAGSG